MKDPVQDIYFLTLAKRVRVVLDATPWYERHGVEVAKFLLRLGLFFLGFAVFSLPGVAWRIGGVAVMSYAYYGIVISGAHQTRHGAFVASGTGNRLWAYFFGSFSWTFVCR